MPGVFRASLSVGMLRAGAFGRASADIGGHTDRDDAMATGYASGVPDHHLPRHRPRRPCTAGVRAEQRRRDHPAQGVLLLRRLPPRRHTGRGPAVHGLPGRPRERLHPDPATPCPGRRPQPIRPAASSPAYTSWLVASRSGPGPDSRPSSVVRRPSPVAFSPVQRSLVPGSDDLQSAQGPRGQILGTRSVEVCRSSAHGVQAHSCLNLQVNDAILFSSGTGRARSRGARPIPAAVGLPRRPGRR
jgi:hypothetical protein